MNEIKLISEKEISLIDNNALSVNQMNFLLKKTPEKYVKTRPAKGGGTWQFVSGGYVKKSLNLMFGFDWDFEVVKFEVIGKQAIVLGKLTCRCGNRTIVKQQFGRQDIKYRKDTNEPMDLGNDLKGATTDALKKCASEIGIASDIYAKEEFESLEIKTDIDISNKKEQIKQLLEIKKEILDIKIIDRVNEIVSKNLINQFDKVILTLKNS